MENFVLTGTSGFMVSVLLPDKAVSCCRVLCHGNKNAHCVAHTRWSWRWCRACKRSHHPCCWWISGSQVLPETGTCGIEDMACHPDTWHDNMEKTGSNWNKTWNQACPGEGSHGHNPPNHPSSKCRQLDRRKHAWASQEKCSGDKPKRQEIQRRQKYIERSMFFSILFGKIISWHTSCNVLN